MMSLCDDARQLAVSQKKQSANSIPGLHISNTTIIECRLKADSPCACRQSEQVPFCPPTQASLPPAGSPCAIKGPLCTTACSSPFSRQSSWHAAAAAAATDSAGRRSCASASTARSRISRAYALTGDERADCALSRSLDWQRTKWRPRHGHHKRSRRCKLGHT